MRNSIAHLVFYLLVLVLQVVIGNHLDTGVWIFVSLLPLIVVGFPPQWDIRLSMLAAFALGLTVDLMTGGVVGVNAAACVVLALVKDPLYRAIVNQDGQNPAWTPTLRSIEWGGYVKFSLACFAVYLFVFSTLDCFSLRPFFFILLKTLLSTLVSTALAALLSLFIPERN